MTADDFRVDLKSGGDIQKTAFFRIINKFFSLRKSHAINTIMKHIPVPQSILTFLTNQDEEDGVTTSEDAKAIVFVNNEEFELDSVQCRRAFHSPGTAKQFHTLLGPAKELALETDGVEVQPEVYEALEELFSDLTIN
jgi:hypothetical protein